MSDRACEVYDWDKEPDLDELRRLMDMQATAPAQALAGLEELAGRGSTMSMVFWPMRTETGSEQTSILCRLGNGSRAAAADSLLASYELGWLYRNDKDYEKAHRALSTVIANG